MYRPVAILVTLMLAATAMSLTPQSGGGTEQDIGRAQDGQAPFGESVAVAGPNDAAPGTLWDPAPAVGVNGADASRASSSRGYDLPGSNAAVTFTNVSVEAGLEGVRMDQFAWGDYNNDGYLDILGRGNSTEGTMLFENSGPPGWNFTEVSDARGILGRGYSTWADVNNDGYLDFVSMDWNERLFVNGGPPDYNFTNATPAAMWDADGGLSEGAGWGDYDNDGYVDLYITSWVSPSGLASWPNCGMPDHLWRNVGGTTFTDASSTAGVATGNPSYASMGCVWGDFDDDGDQDLYVNNYHVNPNYLYENQGDGTFVNTAVEHNVTGNEDYYSGSGPYYGHTAGAGWADWDNDGNVDLFTASLAHKDSEQFGGGGRGYFCDDSMVYLSDGPPHHHFTDVRPSTEIPIIPVGTVQDSMWRDEDYFGVAWADWDNDGDQDLFIPEIKTYHSWASSHLWRNDGDGTFTDVSDAAGAKVWSTSGAAWADYDNDGDQDLIVEGTYPYQGKRQVHLYQNDGNANNWLHLNLTGTVSNREGIGARVICDAGNVIQTRIVGGDGGGHSFQNSYIVEFGLGTLTTVDEIEIQWPSGIVQKFTGQAANQVIMAVEPTDAPAIDSLSATPDTVWEDETVTFTGSASPGASHSLGTYQWDFEGDGVYDQSSPTQTSGSASYPRWGSYSARFTVMDETGKTGSSKTVEVMVNNKVPAASLGEDFDAWEDELVWFFANQSSDTPSDQANLTYEWEMDDGSTILHPGPEAVNRTYIDNGFYTIRVKVWDDDEANDTAMVNVTVNNVLPWVDFTSVPTYAWEDEAVAFGAAGHDTASDLSSLTYKWDYGDGKKDNSWKTSADAQHTYTQAGNYTVSCTVSDDDDEAAFSFNLTVLNPPPSITALENRTAYEDETITFTGSAGDTFSDSATLSYMWDFGDGNATDWSTSPQATHAYPARGVYNVTFMARDDDLNVSAGISHVTVIDLPPSMDMEDAELLEDETLNFIADPNDTPSDKPLIITRIAFPDTEEEFDLAPGEQVNHTFTMSGEYHIPVTLIDPSGDPVTTGFNVTVENVLPEADFDSSVTAAHEDRFITFNASDSEDTPSDLTNLTYEWDFGDGFTAVGMEVKHAFRTSGRHDVELTVTDDDGDDDTTRSGITVINIDPVAVISWINNEVMKGTWDVTEEMIVTLYSNQSTDTPSDMANLTYRWDWGDGTKTTDPVGEHTYGVQGTFAVKLTVTDDDGRSDSVIVTLEVGEAEPDGWSPPEVKDNNTGGEKEGMSPVLIVSVVLIIVIAAVVATLFMWKRGQAKKKAELEAEAMATGPPPEVAPPPGEATPTGEGAAAAPGGAVGADAAGVAEGGAAAGAGAIGGADAQQLPATDTPALPPAPEGAEGGVAGAEEPTPEGAEGGGAESPTPVPEGAEGKADAGAGAPDAPGPEGGEPPSDASEPPGDAAPPVHEPVTPQDAPKEAPADAGTQAADTTPASTEPPAGDKDDIFSI